MAASNPADAAKPSQPRWYVPTPVKFLLAVLLMQGTLFLSTQSRWFWFNESKGYTVLLTAAATSALLLLLCCWLSIALLFRTKSQFSLATLLLMVPVIAVPLGWLMRDVDLAREQRETLEKLRWHAGYKEPSPHLPKYLVSMLGEDFFIDVVDMRIPGATDKDLQGVRRFSGLKSLYLEDSHVTDAGLINLKELKFLRSLVLVESHKSETPLITDAGLEHLSKLRRLQKLNLFGSGISDAGLKHLGTLQQLKELYLTGSPQVTDAGLEHLERLKQLEWLGLSHTSITDAGLQRIQGFTQLVWLEIAGTPVTDDGVKRFEQALPNCDVFRNADFIRAPGRTVRVRL